MMRLFLLTGMALLTGLAAAVAELPGVFKGLLEEGEMTKAETIMIVPPPDIDKFVVKVEEAAKKDPEWFANYSKDAAPGVPLPFHEKLGLTKEEYQTYLELWGKREFRATGQVVLQLRQPKPGEWSVSATGEASIIATLRYLPEKDTFESPNGTLERIDDIDAAGTSILGEWKGQEWRLLEETDLGRTKENLAVGRTGDGKYGLFVYRVQEVSAQGTRLYDRSVIVRYPLKKG